MPIVFRFDSMDSRERATLVIDTPEAAARHVTEVLNEGHHYGPHLWTLDEEGTEVPTFKGLMATLRDRDEVKLYDQSAWNNADTVTIEHAFAPA